MNLIWFIHLLIPMTVILLPFLPVKILKYIFWYPSIFFLIWGLNDGKCPITEMTPLDKYNTDKENFLLPIFNKLFNKNMNANSFNFILGFFKCLVIIICAYKIIYYCDK